MDKDILRSFSGLSLEFCDNKLPHYHKGMKMKFSSKEELFLADETKNLLHLLQRENSYLQISLCQNLRVPLERF